MKIVIKTLQGKQHELEVEATNTVASVKQLVKDKGITEADPELHKLIAYGKVMDNEKTIADYQLKDGDFVVLMTQKAKPAPKKEDVKMEESAPS